MVVGDVITGDGIVSLGEGDTYVYTPPTGIECEVANIYIEPGSSFRMRVVGPSAETAHVGFTDPMLNVNIHLTSATTLEIVYDGVDPANVAFDGIVTRRPPTEYA